MTENEKIPDWKKFYDEGAAYHKTVRGSRKRPEVFTPEIVQNVAAMGIEKYFMSIFTRRGLLPRNHTMFDLLDEAKTFLTISEELEESLLYFDSLQSICSIDDIRIIKPKPDDVQRFCETIDRVAVLADQELALAADAASKYI
jgi:hypothetical protein